MFNLSKLLGDARAAELERSAGPRERRPEVAPVRIRDRFAARLRAHQLDEMLARGVAPSTTPALTWRARILTGRTARDALAAQLRGLLSDAYTGRPPSGHVNPRRAAVVEAGAELQAIVHRLLASGPVDPRGVAQVRLMLSDGETLRSMSRAALRSLQHEVG